MRLAILAGQRAGMVSMLAAAAEGHQIVEVVAYDDTVYEVAYRLGWLTRRKLADAALLNVDLILCCHGREIVPDAVLARAKHGGVNLHPCLSLYPGADPIGRLLADGRSRASVGAHEMTAVVDGGRLLIEEWVDTPGGSHDEVYNALYPLYARVTLAALAAVERSPYCTGGDR